MSIPEQPVLNDMSPPPPTSRLGRYELTGRIATGGMATVYLARLEATGGFAREFALKVVHPHLVGEEGFRQRFHQEARLASRVRHHNVVATIDAGEDKGYCYLVLELIEGATLRQLMLHRERPFAAIEAAFMVAEVARGLHALHTACDEQGTPLNIVHRDLSPHNIMLDQTGRAVLIDLGLAKAQSNINMTQVGVLCGKLPYMSPEQARLEPLDARSDVFALGTVLFELCTGELPFGESHTTATLERLQQCDVGAITEGLQSKSVPPWLVQIIITCLRHDPDVRFNSALELSEALTQELVHARHRSGELKARLAALMHEAQPELGTATPLEPIAPALVGAERTSGSLRWMGLGAIAACLLFGGLYAWASFPLTMGTKQTERPPRFEAGSLAADPIRQPVSADEQSAEPSTPKNHPGVPSTNTTGPAEHTDSGDSTGATTADGLEPNASATDPFTATTAKPDPIESKGSRRPSRANRRRRRGAKLRENNPYGD